MQGMVKETALATTMLAQQLNTCASLTAELLLKSILEGKEETKAEGHDLKKLYEALDPTTRKQLQQEYYELRTMVRNSGRQSFRQLDEAIEWLNGRFVEYRYLEKRERRREWVGVDEMEANHWWSAVLAVKTLEHGAFKWCGLEKEVENIARLPRSIMLRDLKGKTRRQQSLGRMRRKSMTAWLNEALGNDIARTGDAVAEGAIWGASKTEEEIRQGEIAKNLLTSTSSVI